MADSDSDRTEPATSRRRQEYRERGEVAKSRDLAAALALLATLAAMGALGDGLAVDLQASMRVWLEELGSVRLRPLGEAVAEPLAQVGLAVLPLLCVAAIAGGASHLVQSGLLFVPKAIELDFSKLNPLPRLQSIFSMRGLFEGFKSLVKLAVVGAIVYEVTRSDFERLVQLGDASVADGGRIVCAMVLRALAYGGFALFVLGALDYAWARYQMEKKMRMTKQEIKEEHKREEGDPLIKMRIRSKQRQLARSRMIEAVKTADAVVTNPTHFAVAIAYRPGEMAAPQVVAKGADHMARRIRDVATEARVPIFEDKPLARGLYKSVPVGREVPPAFYRAVAELLAWVYSRRRGSAAARVATSEGAR
jgi:flagellar biosynthetic protein FlhB